MADMLPQNQPLQNLTQEDRVIAALSYISILCFVPLIFRPKNSFCQFHGRQGLVMAAIGFFVLIFFAALPLFGFLIVLGFAALNIFALYQAFSGVMWKIPVVSELAAMIGGTNTGTLPSVPTTPAAPPTITPSPQPPVTPPEQKA